MDVLRELYRECYEQPDGEQGLVHEGLLSPAHPSALVHSDERGGLRDIVLSCWRW